MEIRHKGLKGYSRCRKLLVVGVIQLAFVVTAYPQDYGSRLGVQRGGKVSFEPSGPGVMFGALDPTVRRWYVPQELYNEYRWRQWEYSNYARAPYQRYVNTNLEGDYFYDLFGDFVSRGWLIYDWRQDQPVKEGSSIFKGSNFAGFFSNLTVSSDSQGEYAYAITVGNRIRSTLTPMTFSKPNFNGMQIDFAADKYSATILASRINDPASGVTLTPRQWTNSTSLVGGRATVQVGDFITLGGTLVDARNANTSLDMFSGNFIAGNLTSGQSSTPVSAIAIVLSDDSPEDGEGGAALFSHNIRVRTKDFESGLEQVLTLEQIVRSGAEWPTIFGGFQREGFLAADGAERVILNYDFTDPAYIGPDLTSIIDVEFEYLIANDYKIQMWSNRQTGRRDSPPAPLTSAVIDESEPVLLTIKRANGNIKDISNVRVEKFNYGLPTANLIGGFTIEGKDVMGWDFYGEWDRNKQYSQYPNAAQFAADEGHEISSESADAALVTISKQSYPYFAFGEFYSIDGGYSTSAFVTDTDGEVKYDFPLRHVYEFVEDNDDQDSRPDWARVGNQSVDRLVFPGWDENNDFISDFNQNDNTSVPNIIPDYEEPFLRHHVDRPEFLFGIDLNNNGWIDRFEDDELPDYPYKADRQGYNTFAGLHLTPESRIFVGYLNERMFTDDRDNRTTYGMFTFDKDYGLGRLRIFDMVKRVEDTIPEDRRSPAPFRTAPIQPLVTDILRAPDTWVNTAWIGFDYTGIPALSVINKFKYEFYKQNQDDPRDIDGRPLQEISNFIGLINKVEYSYAIGSFELQPKLKSEFLTQEAFVKEDDNRRHWNGLATLLAQVPVLRRSIITAGVEFAQFDDRETDEEDLLNSGQPGETGDQRSAILALQLNNLSQYLGYRLTTQVGLRFGRIFRELVEQAEVGEFSKRFEGRTETTSFITIYAGID